MSNPVSRSLRLAAFAALVACSESGPLDPATRTPRPVPAGDYQLVAPGGSRSQAWENLDFRYEGILAIEQDPADPSRLFGKFSQIRVIYADGSIAPGSHEGVLLGTINATGAVVIHLQSASSSFSWTGRGVFVDGRMSGEWTTADFEAGGFTAQLL